MKDHIESQFTAPVLFLNGAIGDVGPRTNHRSGGGLSAGTGDGIHSVREVAYRAATDAIRALLSIVPMPGEMFSGISLRIRQGSPFQYTLCCSVSNGSLGYLPTREARHRGGYECWVGKAAGAYLLADNIDDALVEQNLKLIRKISGC
jgi:hypothetical protein